MKTLQYKYKRDGKCDNQKKFKGIIEAIMDSTPEGLTEDSPIFPMTSTPVKKASAKKSLCLLTNILGEKKKSATL